MKKILKLIDLKFRRCFMLLIIVPVAYMIISAIISALCLFSTSHINPSFIGDWIFEYIDLSGHAVDYWYIIAGLSLFFGIILVERSDIKFVACWGIGRVENSISNITVAFVVAITFAIGAMVSSLINIAFMRISGGFWITPLMNADIAKHILLSLFNNTMIIFLVIIFTHLIASIYNHNKYIAIIIVLGVGVAVILPFFGVMSNISWKTREILEKYKGVILLGINTVIAIGYAVSERFCEVRR